MPGGCLGLFWVVVLGLLLGGCYVVSRVVARCVARSVLHRVVLGGCLVCC